ncbi:unnamed protein product [Rotaria magnacalcarata]|uniref:Uncharacterized protein n=3 Tax=Rotaria magnacalcarata TaxID=392030 RepID=A0A816NVA4_9BILA|nr:unnamed protein product [Rotaria magnacalcarata]
MEKQNKFNQYDDIIFASEEYKRWMLHPFDENGKRIPFQGVKHCTDDDACQCKKCKKNRIDEWPYDRSLSAHILCLTGVKINDINYDEENKFQESLVAEYLKCISDFWKYLTEVCLLAGDPGIEILHDFYHGFFDKPRVYNRHVHAHRLNISMLTIDRPYNFGDDWHYNDQTTRSPWPITDQTPECIIRRGAILPDVDRKIELLLYLGIPIAIVVFWLFQIIHWICSKYCWNEDEKQTENLQQDSNDLKDVIIHKDEPEDLSVVINHKMKLLATI